jgi:hypothetical protein
MPDEPFATFFPENLGVAAGLRMLPALINPTVLDDAMHDSEVTTHSHINRIRASMKVRHRFKKGGSGFAQHCLVGLQRDRIFEEDRIGIVRVIANQTRRIFSLYFGAL